MVSRVATRSWLLVRRFLVSSRRARVSAPWVTNDVTRVVRYSSLWSVEAFLPGRAGEDLDMVGEKTGSMNRDREHKHWCG